MKQVIVLINKTNKIYCELAELPKDKRKGLMYVKELPINKGLLFKFDSNEIRSFWMKNTYVPLDIIFIINQTIVDIKPKNIPHSTNSVTSNTKCNLVLEVNSNYCKYYNIKVGDKVEYYL